MTALFLLAALAFAYVAGRVHEGCRKGGTLDLAVALATCDRDVRAVTAEIVAARERAGLS